MKFTKALEENGELREEVEKKEKELQIYLKKHFMNSAIQTTLLSEEISEQERKIKELGEEVKVQKEVGEERIVSTILEK